MDTTSIIATALFTAVCLGLAGMFGWQWWQSRHPALVPSTPMPDLGDDPTTDLRDKVKAFCGTPKGDVCVVMDQVAWWKIQNLVADLQFTSAPNAPGGPIVAQDSGDCKNWAAYAFNALAAVGIPRNALRFVYCQYGGSGHLMLGVVDTGGNVWVSEVQNRALVPWAAKLSDHTELRIERGDKALPWQIVTP